MRTAPEPGKQRRLLHRNQQVFSNTGGSSAYRATRKKRAGLLISIKCMAIPSWHIGGRSGRTSSTCTECDWPHHAVVQRHNSLRSGVNPQNRRYTEANVDEPVRKSLLPASYLHECNTWDGLASARATFLPENSLLSVVRMCRAQFQRSLQSRCD